MLLGKMTFEFDFRSDSIGAGEETDFEFEFDGRKETREGAFSNHLTKLWPG